MLCHISTVQISLGKSRYKGLKVGALRGRARGVGGFRASISIRSYFQTYEWLINIDSAMLSPGWASTPIPVLDQRVSNVPYSIFAITLEWHGLAGAVKVVLGDARQRERAFLSKGSGKTMWIRPGGEAGFTQNFPDLYQLTSWYGTEMPNRDDLGIIQGKEKYIPLI